MPYKPAQRTFTDASHEPITHYQESVPESTNGATVQLYDTPQTATETYRALRCAGPAAARIDLDIDGAGFADASSGLAVGGTPGVEQSVQMRAVALPYAGSGDNPQVWFAVCAVDSGAADWLG